MKRIVRLSCVLLLNLAMIMLCGSTFTTDVQAKEDSVILGGTVYTITGEKNYKKKKKKNGKASSSKNTMGSLIINGTVFEDPSVEQGYIADSTVSLSYKVNEFLENNGKCIN